MHIVQGIICNSPEKMYEKKTMYYRVHSNSRVVASGIGVQSNSDKLLNNTSPHVLTSIVPIRTLILFSSKILAKLFIMRIFTFTEYLLSHYQSCHTLFMFLFEYITNDWSEPYWKMSTGYIIDAYVNSKSLPNRRQK